METKQIDFSKRVFILGAIVVVGLIGLWTIQSVNSLAGWIWGYGPREINITAQGKAVAVPDIALVRVGVQTEGKDVSVIVKDNHIKMNAIIEGLKGLGVAEKDIKTTNYSLNPRYDWPEGIRIFKGYTLNQEVSVKVRDFTKVGSVLELAVNKGGNLIGDLQFTIDDETKIKALATADAIAKGKAKAESLAKASGLKLKKIINIYEDTATPYCGYGAGTSMNKEMVAEAVAPQIQAGEQEMTVNITLVYRVK